MLVPLEEIAPHARVATLLGARPGSRHEGGTSMARSLQCIAQLAKTF